MWQWSKLNQTESTSIAGKTILQVLDVTYNMCISELFGSLIDIVSLLFALIDLSCCPCRNGLEEYTCVRAFKIFTGIELIKEEEYANVRKKIVQIPFVICTVFPVFVMNLVESVLLIDANESFTNISSPISIVHVLLIIGLINLLVYFVFMVYFAFCTEKLKDVRFHRLCLLPFHIIDMIINILMLVECFFKTIQPGRNMIFIIFVLSLLEWFFSVIQLINSLILYLISVKC